MTVAVQMLTDNELSVLQGAAAGETYSETAARIFITEKSASNVGLRVMAKLGAQTMAQAVLIGCRAGILDGRRQRHGDHAGFMAHQRRDEDPCDECKAGESAYKASRRAARKRTS